MVRIGKHRPAGDGTGAATLAVRYDRIRAALAASGVGVWSWIDGRLDWDDQMLAMLQAPAPPRDYDAWLALVHPDDRDGVAANVARFVRDGTYEDVQHRLRRGDGTWRWILGRGLAVRDDDGEIRGLMGVAIDITAHKEAEIALTRARDEAEGLTARLAEAIAIQEATQRRLRASLEELERSATTDRLTGCYNRRWLDETLAAELARARRYGTPFALVMLDIDHFKEVNDGHGHAVGDEVLVAVVDRLRAELRSADALVRWGGEEFLVLMPGTGLEGARALADRLREAVRARPLAPVGRVTVSAGVGAWREGDDERTLLKRVDDALYRAKSSGRDRIEAAT